MRGSQHHSCKGTGRRVTRCRPGRLRVRVEPSTEHRSAGRALRHCLTSRSYRLRGTTISQQDQSARLTRNWNPRDPSREPGESPVNSSALNPRHPERRSHCLARFSVSNGAAGAGAGGPAPATEGRLVDIVAGGFDFGVRSADLVPADMIHGSTVRPSRMTSDRSPHSAIEHADRSAR